jgi:hypothetical protein
MVSLADGQAETSSQPSRTTAASRCIRVKETTRVVPPEISSDVSTRSTRRPCFFVSAVSRELAAAREIVGQCLRVYRDVEVVSSPFLAAWEQLIRGIMRYRMHDVSGAKQDFVESSSG